MAAELHSFMWKFSQLCNDGFQADLNFKCEERRITVNMEVKLDFQAGALPSFLPQPRTYQDFRSQKQNKPSKVRRRLRREKSCIRPNVSEDLSPNLSLHEISVEEEPCRPDNDLEESNPGLMVVDIEANDSIMSNLSRPDRTPDLATSSSMDAAASSQEQDVATVADLKRMMDDFASSFTLFGDTAARESQ